MSNPDLEAVPRVGVDTLRLYFNSEQFRVTSDPLLRVYNAEDLRRRSRSQRCRSNRDRLLWRDEMGNEEWGILACRADDSVHVQILATRGAPVGCLTTFSVPKKATGSNRHPTSQRGLVGALTEVNDYLPSIGIEANIYDAALSRVDIFQNVPIQYPLADYKVLLESLRPPHSKGTTVFKTGVMSGNKRYKWLAYEKRAEQLHRRETNPLSVETLRVELQMRKAPTVRRMLGWQTVSDLVDGYQELPAKYRDIAKRHLFKTEPRAQTGPCALAHRTATDVPSVAQLISEAAQSGRPALTRFLLRQGLRALCQAAGTHEVRKAMEHGVEASAGATAQKLLSLRDFWLEHLHYLGNLGDIYAELHQALVQEPAPELRLERAMPIPPEEFVNCADEARDAA